MTQKLYQDQKNKNIHQDQVLHQIEIPLIDVLQKMELTGVKVDKHKLQEI